ncbi:MAG: NAD(P)-dependent oxidoreductase [Candidatus Aenigmatarchaeota archaeon]|nr:MAG: NAD(P)-dependent oxidoreductase [Candidatus Aenigmarchaeota archaeon]
MMLITGASGKLGKELVRLFPESLTPSHSELPIEDKAAVSKYIASHKPDTTIHLVAMTSVPGCETDKEKAWKINVEGTRNMVEALRLHSPGCRFVLMSTPCVFDGDDESPKDESCVPSPDNFYGLTKTVQEAVVSSSGLKHLIVRANFIPYEKYPHARAFIDRKSTYLFAHNVARGIRDVMDAGLTGIVHITGDRVLSMYELAKMCPDSADVEPTTMEEYYKTNSHRLTKSMIITSDRWNAYRIG